MNTEKPYPPMPLNADESVIKPSEAFKKSVINVTWAMLLFVITYVLLITSAIAIGVAFGIIGIALMMAAPHFFTLILGCGLIASGLLLIYFLVKVVFKRNPIDESGMVEVTQDDQPELFEFIKQLTNEVRSPFPKKVFIAPDVNASVFYNATFWTMFFPVRKNLKIGLGLVNGLNISEFKAVMAHEFGHFSQRSMKFGAYVYNMNRIIHDILFENESYNETANAIAKMHYLIRFCVVINIYLIRGIQAILKKLYVFVNKKHLNLSREMEFHADAISAYVSGSNQTINCLRKFEMAHVCYESLFVYLNEIAGNKQRPVNIYSHHKETMQFFAESNDLALDLNGLPIIKDQLAVFSNTNIVVQDQWSSHPTTSDREAHLRKLDLNVQTVSDMAWILFRSPEKLQGQLSDIIYTGFALPHDVLDEATVTQRYKEQLRSRNYNKLYRGFYDNRYITDFNVDEAANESAEALSFEQLFNDDNCNTPAAINGIKIDIGTIDAIINSTEIKTFDFKGVKYGRENAMQIKEQLQRDMIQREEKLATLDKRVFKFFYNKSQKKDSVIDAYKQYFEAQKQTKEHFEFYDKLAAEISPIFTTMKYADIEKAVSVIYNREEELKPLLRHFIDNENYSKLISVEDLKSLEIYLSKKWIYFNKKTYDDPSVDLLTRTVRTYYSTVSEYLFLAKKNLTDNQLTNDF